MEELKFDRRYWCVDDPEWMQERERTWLIYEAFCDKYNFWSRDFDVDVQKASRKRFYFYGQDFTHVCWQDICELHPEVTAEALKPLIDHMREYFDGYSNFLGTVYSRYELVNLGFWQPERLRQLYLTLQGSTYQESAEILQFDPQESLGRAASECMSMISGYRKKSNPEIWPIDIMMSHYKSVMRKLDKALIELHGFKLELHISNALQFSKKNPDAERFKHENAAESKAFLLSSEVHPAINEIAKRYA